MKKIRSCSEFISQHFTTSQLWKVLLTYNFKTPHKYIASFIYLFMYMY